MPDEDPESTDADEGAGKKDLRRTAHEDFGVSVERDMTGSSMFLARGSHQHFSKIKFSARGTPREPAKPEAASPAEAAADHSPAAPSAETTPPPTPEEPGVFAKLKGLLGF